MFHIKPSSCGSNASLKQLHEVDQMVKGSESNRVVSDSTEMFNLLCEVLAQVSRLPLSVIYLWSAFICMCGSFNLRLGNYSDFIWKFMTSPAHTIIFITVYSIDITNQT